MATAEHDRLAVDARGWRRWAPYLAERASGTVREHYSPGGDLVARLVATFREGSDCRRPVNGPYLKFHTDRSWHDAIPFHEYFDGDTGAGLGASHQTGWTGLVADMLLRKD